MLREKLIVDGGVDIGPIAFQDELATGWVKGDRRWKGTFLEWEPARGRLTLDEREDIAAGLVEGVSFAGIARRLGRTTSTIAREVQSNGGQGRYRPRW